MILQLPEDLFDEIMNYLDYKSLDNILMIDKKNNKIRKKERNLVFRNQLIREFFPKIILNVLNFHNQYPLLRFKNNFFGGTGYIDRIRLSDVSSPVMLGIDKFERPFFTLRMNVNGEMILQTFFQRYTNNPRTWSMGTSYNYFHTIGSNCISLKERDVLRKLVEEKTMNRKIYDYNDELYEQFDIKLV